MTGQVTHEGGSLTQPGSGTAETKVEAEGLGTDQSVQDSPAERVMNRVTAGETPWTKSRFWLLQVVILALAMLRLAATVAFNLDTASVALEFSTLAIFLVPVLYAALNYGLAGALFTASWVTLLAIPRLVDATDDRNGVGAWAELGQVVLLLRACVFGGSAGHSGTHRTSIGRGGTARSPHGRGALSESVRFEPGAHTDR